MSVMCVHQLVLNAHHTLIAVNVQVDIINQHQQPVQNVLDPA